MTDCESCGSGAVEAYRLPGGDVVHADDVPFTDGPQGVDAIQVCRQCGAEVAEDGDHGE